MVFVLYFWLRIVGKNTSIEWHFYNFTKWFLKDINKVTIYFKSNNWGSRFFCNDIQFDTGVSLPICSYCKLLHFIVIVWQHCWNEKRQCSLPKSTSVSKWLFHGSKVISVWGWVSVIARPHPPREQSVQDFATRYKNFDHVFVICYRKFIDWLETKMIIVDPSILGQHVQLFKNNYFKACTLTQF